MDDLVAPEGGVDSVQTDEGHHSSDEVVEIEVELLLLEDYLQHLSEEESEAEANREEDGQQLVLGKVHVLLLSVDECTGDFSIIL